jgi:hypothetical protein
MAGFRWNVETRLAAFVAGCFAWRVALGLWETGVAPFHTGLQLESALASLLGFAMFFLAASERRENAWQKQLFIAGSLAFLFALTVQASFLRDRRFEYGSTNDALAYVDEAARVFRSGRNPYEATLSQGLAAQRLSLETQTPLTNGSLTSRLAYPPGSFLLVLPFTFGTRPELPYLAAFFGLVILAFKRNKERALTLLAAIGLFTPISYHATHGVTDFLWIFFAALALGTENLLVAGAAFGVACLVKQQAWLLAPYLVFRTYRKSGRGEALRFFCAATGIFAVGIVPFFCWNPSALIAGIFEPFRAPMVPFGEGLASLRATGAALLEKQTFVALFALVHFLSFSFLLLEPRRAGKWVILFPALASFFGPRALSSYWIFHTLLLAAEPTLFSVEEAPRFGPVLAGRLRRGLELAMGAAVVGTAVVVIRDLRRTAAAIVEVLPKRMVKGSRVSGIEVFVTNRAATPLRPKFWVYGTQQAFLWTSEGPEVVAPGTRAFFRLSTERPGREFDLTFGAGLVIRNSEGLDWGGAQIAGQSPKFGDLANSNFALWEPEATLPVGFYPIESHSDASVSLRLDGPGLRVHPRLPDGSFGFSATTIYAEQILAFALPEPACPDFTLRIEAGGAAREWNRADLAAGAVDGWKTLDLGEEFRGRDTEHFLRRADAVVDVPFRQLRLEVRGRAAREDCFVGTISNVHRSEKSTEEKFRNAIDAHPGLMDAWEAIYADDEGAEERAKALLGQVSTKARDAVPFDFLVGAVPAEHTEFLRAVLALTPTNTPTISQARAWDAYRSGDKRAAQELFQARVDAPWVGLIDRRLRHDALFGLALILRDRGDCEGARRLLDQRAADGGGRPPVSCP